MIYNLTGQHNRVSGTDMGWATGECITALSRSDLWKGKAVLLTPVYHIIDIDVCHSKPRQAALSLYLQTSTL